MNPNASPSKFIKRLENAYQCCDFCGTLYGEAKPGSSTMWTGTCDVCGEESAVTETRDYGYLQKGIQRIKNRRKTT